MSFEASWDLGSVLPELLPHLLRRRGGWITDSSKRGEGVERIEVFHSIRTMLRRPHKVVAREKGVVLVRRS